MHPKCLASCLTAVFLLLSLTPTHTMSSASRCPHQNVSPSSSSSVSRATRSVPAVAAVFAGAAAAVSAAANSSPDWTTEDDNSTDNSEQVTQRLEYIKQEILRRLGLTDVPRVKRQIDPSNLLKYFQTKLPNSGEGDSESSEGLLSDESYEPDQIVILPVISSSTSVTFNLTSSRLARAITRMVLFVSEKSSGAHAADVLSSAGAKEVSLYSSSQWRKDGINRVASKQTLEKHLATVGPVASSRGPSNEVPNSSVHSLTFDLTSTMRASLAERSTSYLTINSKHFKMADAHIRIEFEEPQVRKKRSPRDCTAPPNEMQACCREHFFVNFTSIGWNNWVVFPPGYAANYCRGLCNPNSARYHHTEVLQLHPWKVDLCCSPRELSGISLIYLTDNMVIQTTIPNMTVESCDCA